MSVGQLQCFDFFKSDLRHTLILCPSMTLFGNLLIYTFVYLLIIDGHP